MTFTPRCIMCGQPANVPAMQPGYEGGGDQLDHWWLCHDHRKQLRGVMPTPASPGRPPLPAPEARVRRLRGLSHRLSAARQRPQAPQMPHPTADAPTESAPKMPGPFS